MKESATLDKIRLYGFDPAETPADLDLDLAVEEQAEEAAAEETEAEDISAAEAFAAFVSGDHGHNHDRDEGFWPNHDFPGGREEARHPLPSHPPRRDRDHDRDRHPYNPHSGSAPRFAPPAFVPKAPGPRAADPSAISNCLYSFTYLWLSNRQQFWFFPTFVGRRSLAGYRWVRDNWVFMGFDLRLIDSFTCSAR